MPIDPVILLVEQIRGLEKQIHASCHGPGYDRERMEAANGMIGQLRTLYGELLRTEPDSAPGAGEMIRIAADRLPFAQGRYASHLYRIADRLCAGERLAADLIWVRALAEALAEGQESGPGSRTARMLAAAVHGMARPVLVWRAALPARAPAHDLGVLSRGPGEMTRFVPGSF
jgi:hypothetical protein